MSAPRARGRVAAASWVMSCGCIAADDSHAGETAATTGTPGESAAANTEAGESTTSADATSESTAPGEDTGAVATQRCGIDDLAPGASNPLVASDTRPMQLPLEIADILTRSCGCHLADDLVIAGDYPAAGPLDLTTWAGWHVDFGSVPTYEAARRRLDPEVPLLVMPPPPCDVGGGETMLPEDRARMLEWIAALAPDGVIWSMR